MKRMFGYLLIFLIVGMAIYIRTAPIDTDHWHQPIHSEVDNTMKGGAIRILPNSQGAFAALNGALKSLERTEVIAGSADSGHVTYVTRSKWIGFPDYTTLEQSENNIKMYARLRFGRRDMGVNAARLRKLMSSID